MKVQNPTYQETTDRINALGYALSILNDSPRRVVGSIKDLDPVNQAIQDVSCELSTLTSVNKTNIKGAVPEPPKAPAPPETRIINEGQPQD